jgi:excisionase family DNA binding protein
MNIHPDTTPTLHGAKSVREFCAHWRISRATFYQLVKSGQLRAVKLGRATRVTAADEAAFANSLQQLGRAA